MAKHATLIEVAILLSRGVELLRARSPIPIAPSTAKRLQPTVVLHNIALRPQTTATSLQNNANKSVGRVLPVRSFWVCDILIRVVFVILQCTAKPSDEGSTRLFRVSENFDEKI